MNEDETQELYMKLIKMGIDPKKAYKLIEDETVLLYWKTIKKWAKEHFDQLKYDLLAMFVAGRKLL